MRARNLAAAWLADMTLGEPAVGHPVRGMGRALLGARRWNAGTRSSAVGRKLAGAAVVLGGACASWGFGRLVAGRRAGAEGTASLVRAGVALSFVVSLRELLAAGRRVRDALDEGDLARARASLGRDLVGRDTTQLGSEEVAGAAIQSLAENLNDAFVAPLFWALVSGPGAAYAYRWVNTADAVLGHRTSELQAFGWAAARSDDLLGWIPARLSAAAIVLAAPTLGLSSRGACEALRSSAHLTPSPNGGWPMSALAGALNVRLEKKGAYVLHPEGAPPGVEHLVAAERLLVRAGVMVVALALAADLTRGGDS